jgi:hypothetical protein
MDKFLQILEDWRNGWRHPNAVTSAFHTQQRRSQNEANYGPYVRWLIAQRQQEST